MDFHPPFPIYICIYNRWCRVVLEPFITLHPFSHISTVDGRRYAGGNTCVIWRAYAGGPTLCGTGYPSTIAGPHTVTQLPIAFSVMLRL